MKKWIALISIALMHQVPAYAQKTGKKAVKIEKNRQINTKEKTKRKLKANQSEGLGFEFKTKATISSLKSQTVSMQLSVKPLSKTSFGLRYALYGTVPINDTIVSESYEQAESVTVDQDITFREFKFIVTQELTKVFYLEFGFGTRDYVAATAAKYEKNELKNSYNTEISASSAHASLGFKEQISNGIFVGIAAGFQVSKLLEDRTTLKLILNENELEYREAEVFRAKLEQYLFDPELDASLTLSYVF